MIMTSQEVSCDLREIDWLIATLRAAPSPDDDDFEDLRWLLTRRRFLSQLLAVRREERGKKVVSLEVWRHGRTIARSSRREDVGTQSCGRSNWRPR
jgi:hypothetical protein